MKTYFVYILYSLAKKRYYIGHTQNLVLRLKRHNDGQVRATKYGIPWEIIHFEPCEDKQNAYKREMQIKKYKGGEAFKKLIAASAHRLPPPTAGSR